MRIAPDPVQAPSKPTDIYDPVQAIQQTYSSSSIRQQQQTAPATYSSRQQQSALILTLRIQDFTNKKKLFTIQSKEP